MKEEQARKSSRSLEDGRMRHDDSPRHGSSFSVSRHLPCPPGGPSVAGFEGRAFVLQERCVPCSVHGWEL